ncbi:hypothetical protein AAVH_34422, partial [Aphelenchoides avenae]
RSWFDVGASPIINLSNATGGSVVTLFTGNDSTARRGELKLGGTEPENCDGARTAYKQKNLTGASGIVNWYVAVS